MIPPEDQAYYDATVELLEEAYLAADNPRSQSGFGGDAAKWERDRRPIVAAVHRGGTFLDVGCASGHLMECVAAWAAADGFAIEPHGLDLIPSMADLARRRLRHWADRIHVGNVMTWEPPRRYDYVRTEGRYVPDWRRRDLVARLLDRFLVPGGRMILCSYGSSRRPEPAAEPVAGLLRSWGYELAGSAEVVAPTGRVTLRAAWVDSPQPRTSL